MRRESYFTHAIRKDKEKFLDDFKVILEAFLKAK